tara:strand:- start:21679 stop:22257 length:579 start_codon:yes stop_codon:yes gene_type:complete
LYSLILVYYQKKSFCSNQIIYFFYKNNGRGQETNHMLIKFPNLIKKNLGVNLFRRSFVTHWIDKMNHNEKKRWFTPCSQVLPKLKHTIKENLTRFKIKYLIIYSIKYLNLKDFKNLNPYFIIIIGICIAITSCITYKIIKITPNPAYIRIFTTIDIIVILLISYLFFKEKIKCMMLIGFVLISLGVMILTYY